MDYVPLYLLYGVSIQKVPNLRCELSLGRTNTGVLGAWHKP